ncbi:hypothetical protein FQA47_005037 [Oryzias melastigma]|uniref:Uncharacterized protein n=1 Tax=Oryzias melastigma TaxID=30732 RepID=A0A834FTU0_ORYME|nr:hypothetical protein FQA47_005037 [Oryzias melastigma]
MFLILDFRRESESDLGHKIVPTLTSEDVYPSISPHVQTTIGHAFSPEHGGKKTKTGDWDLFRQTEVLHADVKR